MGVAGTNGLYMDADRRAVKNIIAKGRVCRSRIEHQEGVRLISADVVYDSKIRICAARIRYVHPRVVADEGIVGDYPISNRLRPSARREHNQATICIDDDVVDDFDPIIRAYAIGA